MIKAVLANLIQGRLTTSVVDPDPNHRRHLGTVPKVGTVPKAISNAALGLGTVPKVLVCVPVGADEFLAEDGSYGGI